MFFGLPWFAIVAIVAIGGGLIYAYKEQELKMEEKRRGSSREFNEMRQIVHNLKSRIENLEAIISEEKRRSPRRESSSQGDIEIEGENEAQNNDNIGRSGKAKTQ